MRYRSKPVEIEATQWFKPGDHEAVTLFYDAIGKVYVVMGRQGRSRVNSGDWIICEPSGGGFYPCAPDVFAAKYEPIPE